ncbi:hypothetical protein CR513_19345, partial [Mucuna pruriens]
MKELETIREYFDKLLSIANREQKQKIVMRQGVGEGALLVKHQEGRKMTRKKKGKKNLATSGDVVANENATTNTKNKTRGPKGNYPSCQTLWKNGSSSSQMLEET